MQPFVMWKEILSEQEWLSELKSISGQVLAHCGMKAISSLKLKTGATITESDWSSWLAIEENETAQYAIFVCLTHSMNNESFYI